MKILAFDTALGGCSVAVVDTATGKATSEIRPMGRGQSEVLVPMVQEIVAKSGISFSDLDLIVTTVGPGAFTGLRIGLSAARSFALALDVPVDGLTTTEVIAAAYFNQNNDVDRDLLVVIETKRDDFYVQLFLSDNKAIDDAASLSSEVIATKYQEQNLTVCGDGACRLRETLGVNWSEGWKIADGFELSDAVVMAHLGFARREAGAFKPADPLYLREADVSVSSRPARTIAVHD